MSKVVTFI